MKKPVKLFLLILFSQTAGILGSFFTMPAIPAWYQFLNKPTFSPPNWIFAPVWTLLYALMGVALFIILESEKNSFRKKALIFFAIQFILNLAWSFLFFGLRSPLLGLIGIIILLIFIILTIISFLKIKKTAGIVLIPYLLWVSFASILNFSILILNK
jgi:translocator protein